VNVFNNPDIQRLARVFQSGNNHKLKTAPPHVADRPSPSDSVVISEEAKLLAGIKQRLDAVPDVRRERVESLKRAIESGEYRVPSEAIAEAMIREGAV